MIAIARRLFPAFPGELTQDATQAVLAASHEELERFTRERALEPAFSSSLERLHVPLAAWIAAERARVAQPFVLGIAGAQGTGKSTLAAALAILLRAGFRLRAVVLALDDFYRTRAERERLARELHPLLRTRGVPGTHDTELAARVLEALGSSPPGETIAVPRFDKAQDDRMPASAWTRCEAPADVVLFEGWCVGARAEPAAALAQPINAFENDEDPDGSFRRHVNSQLEGPYRKLFGRLDGLVFLAAPDFESALRWRTRQERELAARRPGSRPMNARELERFVQHFERVSRFMLADTPAYADIVLWLDREHRVERVELHD